MNRSWGLKCTLSSCYHKIEALSSSLVPASLSGLSSWFQVARYRLYKLLWIKSVFRLNQYSSYSFHDFLCFVSLIIHRRKWKFWFNLRTDFTTVCTTKLYAVSQQTGSWLAWEFFLFYFRMKVAKSHAHCCWRKCLFSGLQSLETNSPVIQSSPFVIMSSYFFIFSLFLKTMFKYR